MKALRRKARGGVKVRLALAALALIGWGYTYGRNYGGQK